MSYNREITVQENVGIIRHETFEGRDHLVVPAIMLVEGVLNEAFVPAEEFGKIPEAWDGRPVPILHPEERGIPISANAPDVLERTVGRIHNTTVKDNKLHAELWIDTTKAERLGIKDMIEALESGQVMELSTGYYCDAESRGGIHEGREYKEIHRNLRPDHCALLPNQIGACSVEDGCGAPRVNQKGFSLKLNEALDTIRQVFNLSNKCDGDCSPGACHCNGGSPMLDKKSLVQRAKKLHANEKLSPEQMEMLQNLAEDEQQLKMAKAFLDAIEAPASEEVEVEVPPPEEMAEDEDQMATLAANEQFATAFLKTLTKRPASKPKTNKDEGGVFFATQADFNNAVAEQVTEQTRRIEAMRKLTANEDCPLDDDDLKAMSTEALEKLERSIRPQDFGGQGGFATNGGEDADASPLVPNRGVLTRDSKDTKEA